MLMPLYNALPDFVWRWDLPRFAHLVKIPNCRRALCGVLAQGTKKAIQVGGYSVAPCIRCAELSGLSGPDQAPGDLVLEQP